MYVAALAVAAVLAAFAPLADHLGYELAELIALVAGLLGASVGVAAARNELHRHARGLPASAEAALLSGLALALLALAVPVAIILLNGVRRPPCDPLAGLALYAALPVPSALLAAALGAACGFLAPRRAVLWVALVFVATLAATVVPLLRGPQVFAFHHLGGMYPGPLYDEAVSTSPALWAFRACTLLYAGACGGLALAAGARRLEAVSEPPPEARSRPGIAGRLIFVLSGAAALALSANAEALHWKASGSLVSETLGGRLETAHLILHFPREKPEEEQRLLALDGEVSVREVSDFYGLGAAPTRGKIEVWLYRSAEEKRRLIGAAETSFTKPWLRQIHTNDAPAPHPILRHELAHALGADFARGPFGVPGRLHGLLPDMAFIEGIAVAADWPAGEATIHEEAAAIRKLGKAAGVERLFSPGLFYAESGPRAYAEAGSFLRFLWRERGAEALRRAYGSARGLAELGSLRELAAAHARFLDEVPVPAHVQALAALRFSAKAIVHKSCAHEVAQRSREAAQAAQRGDFSLAARLLRTCTELEPDDPELLLALRRALFQDHQNAAAFAAAQRALAHPNLSPPQRARLLTELGDEAWTAGDTGGAELRYATAARLAQPEGAERALLARRYALLDPGRWPAARKLLTQGDAGPETLLALDALAGERPREGFAPYLLAKQLQNRGAWAACARFAQLALERELPHPLFVQEALRMRGISAWHLGDAAAARASFERLSHDATPGRALEAAHWRERIDAL
ncbi:MAG TPA: hypothetical protein VN874_05895 [Myxococcales bacterium]|jgi:hypothetical protein|nr:hypothetical protein [Myxococcales bacterium]